MKRAKAKTASSAAAASLLQSAGRPLIGFDTPALNIFDTIDNTEQYSDLDSESKIILKKLTKKDAQTREKGLRELLDELRNGGDTRSVELCCPHFVSMFTRLALDGSPTVRSLSLRVASLLLQTLKKSAERHLKKIMPIVLLANSDASASVGNEASGLVKDCFSEEKRKAACELFAIEATKFAVQCATGENEILQKQKYDDEETEQQRSHRLVVQSLKSLTVLAAICPEKEAFDEILLPLFTTPVVKKFLATDSAQEKQHLLRVSLLAKDPVEVLLSSGLAQFVSSSLDSSHNNLAEVAFQIFEKLASDERFRIKFNLKKTIIPRLLNVIRKKQPYWRVVSDSLASSVLAIYAHLPSEDNSSFLLSSILSFQDNLPFENVPCFSQWASAFQRLASFAASTASLSIEQQHSLATSILKAMEIVTSESEEAQTPIVSLLVDIIKNSYFSEEPLRNFIHVLKGNLLNSRPASLPFTSRLVSHCLAPLLDLHVSALSDSLSTFPVFFCLRSADEAYFESIIAQVDLGSIMPTRDWTKSEADQLAPFLVRLLEKYPNKSFKIEANIFGQVFVGNPALEWERLKSCTSLDVLRQIMKEYMLAGKVEEAKQLLAKMPKTERMTILEGCTEEKSAKATAFLSHIVGCVELDSEHAEVFVDAIFESLFLEEERQLGDDVIEVLSRHRPSEGCRRRIVCEALDGLKKQHYEKRIDQMARVIEKLLELNAEAYALLLPCDEDLIRLCEDTEFLDIDFSAYSLVVSEQLLQRKGHIGKAKIWDAKAVGQKRKLATLYSRIQSKNETLLRQAHLLSICLEVSLFHWSHWNVHYDHEPLLLSTSVLLSALSLVISYLDSFHFPDKTLLFATLRYIHIELSKRDFNSKRETGISIPDILILSQLKLKEKYDSTESSEEALQQEIDALWGKKYLDVCKNLPEGAFSAGSVMNTYLVWWMGQALDEQRLDEMDADALDCLLCGLVTLFESSDSLLFSEQVLDCAQVEVSVGLRLFARLSRTASTHENARFDSEWEGFYLPALSRFVLRWVTLLPVDCKSTLFVRSLLEALCSFTESVPLDYDLGVSPVFSPEFDAFSYPGELQSLMETAARCALSSSVVVQLIGMQLLRRLADAMYRQENGEWSSENEQEQISAEKKLKVPCVVSRLASQEGLPCLFAFDCALVPLLSACIQSEEERVVYCDALLPLVGQLFPSLISACPQHIPRDAERSWFLSSSLFDYRDVSGSYACGLLYRALSTLPAIIRIWYNSLPSNAAQLVHRYLKNRNVSKLLIEQELSKVKTANRDGTLNANSPLKVYVVPATGEVVAEYTVEETTMRLSICLPPEYPLRVPSIVIDKAVVPNERAKKWLLQMTAYIFHKNGSIVDGILMWRRNVDKNVEGAEACCICMMTIHTNSHQLPKVKCRKCKNKFHSNCLYKWFESSNQATCPLCRSNFT